MGSDVLPGCCLDRESYSLQPNFKKTTLGLVLAFSDEVVVRAVAMCSKGVMGGSLVVAVAVAVSGKSVAVAVWQ